MKRIFTVLLTMAVVALGAGCGEEYLPILDEGNPKDVSQETIVPDTVEETTDEGRDTAAETTDEHRYQIILQVDSTAPTDATVGTEVNVSAVVVDYMQAQPAENVLVSFTVSSVEDLDGNPAVGDSLATFETASKYTGTQGRVDQDFYVGMVPDLVYTITLALPDFPDAAPVTMKVKVLPYACGCLRVDFKYNGTIDDGLRDINVMIIPKTLVCNKDVYPTSNVSGVVIAQRSAPNVSSIVTFDCLPAGTSYTVFAQAGSSNLACTTASSCSRTLVLAPDTCDYTTLELEDIRMQPAGRYNAVDHFNFEPLVKMCAGGDTSIIGCVTAGTEDVGKLVCCALQEVVKFFKTPEVTLVELVFDALKLWIGSAIIDAIEGVLAGPIEDLLGVLIDQWTANSPWLSAFETAGADITQVISHLELESELVLEKSTGDIIQGTHYWHAINLYWRQGCAAEGDPNYDPECGKYSLDMEDLTVIPEGFPMDLLEGTFLADVFDFNKLSLRQHEIALSYGKLVLWALNDIFIPVISGGQAHSVEELANMWLDCAGLAAGQLGDYVEQAGGDRSKVEQLCNQVVATLINPVDDMLGRLSLATTLTLQGNAVMVDDDCDSNSTVDKIIDGTYTGYIESNNSQASVTGDWSAVRIDDTVQ